MMKKESLAICSSIFLLWGCSSGDSGQVNPSASTSSQKPENSQQQESTAQDNNNSDILTASNNNVIPGGLIPTTDAQQRLKQIDQGRTDPFRVINLNLPPRLVKNQSVASSVNGIASVNGIKGINLDSQSVSEQNSQSKTYCPRTKQDGSGEYGSPQPHEARAVLVSGIINIEGEDVAIVKSPEYSYSYPVRVGNYLENGQVFVKNIEPYGKNPAVILEQYGKEVVRRVGEAPSELGEAGSGAGFTIVKPQGPDLFGLSRGLLVTTINVDQEPIALNLQDDSSPAQTPELFANISGTLCNDNSFTIQVSSLNFQIEDNKGTVLSSTEVDLDGNSFVLKPGQIAEFDGKIKVKDRLAGDINIQLKDWGGDKYEAKTW